MAVNTRIVVTGIDRGAFRTFRKIAGASTDASRKIMRTNNELKKTDKSMKLLKRTAGVLSTALLARGGLRVAFEGVRKSLEVKFDFDRIRNTLKTVTGSTVAASRELKFLAGTADELGLQLRPLAQTYSRLLASTKQIGLSTGETQTIFENFSKALTTFGATREQSIRVFTAIEQIAAKGVVSMEELRQQLGEALPGALSIAAQSMNLTEKEFIKLVSAGKVASKDFLVPFSERAGEVLGKGAVDGAKLLNREFDRLINVTEQLFLTFAEGEEGGGFGGFADGLASAIQNLTEALKDPELKTAISDIGSRLGVALKGITEFATDSARFASTLGERTGVSQGIDITNFLLDSLTGATPAEIKQEEAKQRKLDEQLGEAKRLRTENLLKAAEADRMVTVEVSKFAQEIDKLVNQRTQDEEFREISGLLGGTPTGALATTIRNLTGTGATTSEIGTNPEIIRRFEEQRISQERKDIQERGRQRREFDKNFKETLRLQQRENFLRRTLTEQQAEVQLRTEEILREASAAGRTLDPARARELALAELGGPRDGRLLSPALSTVNAESQARNLFASTSFGFSGEKSKEAKRDKNVEDTKKNTKESAAALKSIKDDMNRIASAITDFTFRTA